MFAIQEKFTQMKIRQTIKKPARREAIAFENIRTVGVIFTVKDLRKHEAVKKFIRNLENEGKRVEVISFLGKDKDNHEFMFDFFTEKNVNFWGNVMAENLKKFVETPFDYLVCLDLEMNIFIDVALARTKAKCRVGGYVENKTDLLEYIIKPAQKNFDKLADDIYHYLKSLT